MSIAGRDQTRVLLPADNGTARAGIEVEGDVLISGLTMEQRGTDAVALAVSSFPTWFTATLEVRESRFIGGAVGVVSYAFSVSVEQCEFIGQADEALLLNRSSHGNQLNAALRDCLLVDHGVGGKDLPSLFGANVGLQGCTVVSDCGFGIDAFADLTGCIVAGHPSGDLRQSWHLNHCLIEDGLPAASNATNVAGDPQFVDRAGGDFRLGWGSPCIDMGFSSTGHDVLGRPRAVDGDLQLEAAPDMGALEHQTLSGPMSVRLGDLVPLELTGPAGGFSTVVISPGGYAAVGATNPFGRFFLDPSAAFRITSVPTFGVTPTTLNAPAFTDPALVGTRVGFQALTRSTAAPAGGAYSQPILVRIDA